MAYGLQGHERTNAFEDAIKAYDKAIEMNPKYGDAWKDKGYSLNALATFNKDLNLEAFDKAIELIPANDTRNLALAWEGKALALTNTANALADMASSKREEAIKSYEKAIELDPDFTGLEAQLNRAGVLADLGKYNESIAAFDKAIEANPANPPGNDPLYIAIIWADKGSVLEKMGKHAEALKAFDKALELNPSDMIAMQGKGNALKAMGRTSESDAAFAKAKELGYNTSPEAQEKTSDYWIKIGDDLALNKSNNQEALAAYEKAIQIDPENAIAWINKAYALTRLNKTAESNLAYHKALEMTNKTLETDPRNVTLWLEKGLLLNNVGNVKEAVKALGNATSIDPKNEMAWKMEGVILANDLHKYNEAVKAFDSALQIDLKDGQVWNLKGNALKALGNNTGAVDAFADAKKRGYKD